jgi:hypothetical protein
MISKRIELLSVVLAVIVLVLVCVLVFKMSNKEHFQGEGAAEAVGAAEGELEDEGEGEDETIGLPPSANNAEQATPEEIAAAENAAASQGLESNNSPEVPVPVGMPLNSLESIAQAQNSIELSGKIDKLQEHVNEMKSMMAACMNGSPGAGMNGEGPSVTVMVPEDPASSPDGFTTSSLVTTASILTPE